ncbi:ABC transporter substrate-binding protein [Lawsonibacter sp. JLR.KK007]|uniref:ABC transporter substrate-binding protein n=1 Tax=Lawsonibacter sp. JLR.KK007 TaxID=3114293 RepID=UPI002FEF4395
MKKVLCTVLALAMTLSLAACGGGGTSTPAANGSGSGNASTPASSASGETIKIGYFTDMSSADGYIGMAGYYALEDRIEELNANGGLLGQQIELIAYDNAGKNEEVVNIVNKLCYADNENLSYSPITPPNSHYPLHSHQIPSFLPYSLLSTLIISTSHFPPLSIPLQSHTFFIFLLLLSSQISYSILLYIPFTFSLFLLLSPIPTLFLLNNPQPSLNNYPLLIYINIINFIYTTTLFPYFPSIPFYT